MKLITILSELKILPTPEKLFTLIHQEGDEYLRCSLIPNKLFRVNNHDISYENSKLLTFELGEADDEETMDYWALKRALKPYSDKYDISFEYGSDSWVRDVSIPNELIQS